MHSYKLLIGLLAASPVFGDRCDVHADGVLPPHSLQHLLKRQAPAPPPIALMVHVIAASERREDGYLTAAEVNKQVQVIKDLYKPTGITFQHDAGMTRWRVNASWAGDSRDFDEMKTELHVGDYRTLNLYIRNVTLKDYGGTCTNPWRANQTQPDPVRRLALDGCVINTISIPDSGHAFLNQGKTAVHEIGHWFGLWHTFEDQGIRNGVNPPNPCWEGNPDDDVADTPKMQNRGSGTCNLTQNSCPEPAGSPPIYDPVQNFMSYSSDQCMTEFSPGQVQRMYSTYDRFRKNA